AARNPPVVGFTGRPPVLAIFHVPPWMMRFPVQPVFTEPAGVFMKNVPAPVLIRSPAPRKPSLAVYPALFPNPFVSRVPPDAPKLIARLLLISNVPANCSVPPLR